MDWSGALRLGLLALTAALCACGGGATDGTAPDMGSDAARDIGGPELGVPDLGFDAGCADEDGDGHAALSCGGDDCDDHDGNRFPGHPEVCDTLGHDEDCETATLGPDADGDHYVSTMCCNTGTDGMLHCGLDCDDSRATVSPDAHEACNGSDDDCNGVIDDGVQLTFFRDIDSDGYGQDAMTMDACSAPTGYVPLGGDCDDSRGAVHPGATETCDGIDNDCTGAADPPPCTCVDGATRPCGTPDMMGGFVTTPPCMMGTQRCIGGAWEAACPGGVLATTEMCNMVDDDCDGTTDEGTRVTCYRDTDDDGYAAMGTTSMSLCSVGTGMCPSHFTTRAPTSASSIDCDDTTATGAPRHPGATESGCDRIDNDCDGATDENNACHTGGPSTRSLTVCGIGCSQACNAATCSYACACTLGTTSWSWNGDDSAFTLSGIFACPNHVDTSIHWRWFEGSGAPCDLEAGPTGGSTRPLPKGDYTADVWLSGNVQGDIYVRNSAIGTDLAVRHFDLNAAAGIGGWHDVGGFKVVDVPFTVVSYCTPVWIDVRLSTNGTCAIAATHIYKNSAMVSDSDDTAVVCP